MYEGIFMKLSWKVRHGKGNILEHLGIYYFTLARLFHALHIKLCGELRSPSASYFLHFTRTVHHVLCFVIDWYGILLFIAPVPVKQPWWINIVIIHAMNPPIGMIQQNQNKAHRTPLHVTKPLPDPQRWPVAFTGAQFHKQCSWT